ncbi:MAG: response regulator [Firmicutes bacterium]|nr:response regulator [Bacillota bacterium]
MANRTVLFVDDEINVLNALKRGLIDEDYRCEFALNAKDALKIMEEQDICVLVTDMKMPGMDGLSLLKIIKEKYPNTVRIVLSGYTQLPQVLATINQADVFKFITKPWKLEEEFKHVIRQAVEYYNLQMESIELKKTLEARNISYQKILKSMEEKLTNNKEDFENIKNIGSFILDSIESNINEIKPSSTLCDELVNQTRLIKQLYMGYLDTVPTTNTNFDLKKLVEELKCYLTSLNSVSNVIFNTDNLVNYKCVGNYKLLYFILTFTLGKTLCESNKNNLNLTVVSDRDADNIKLDFLVEIRTTNIGISEENGFARNELILIEKLMNKISMILNGSMVIYKDDGDTIIKLQIKLKKSTGGL